MPEQNVTTPGQRIEAKDLRCKDRLPLQEVIPLSTPLVVYIDPTNKCNFRCEFCPTSDKILLRKVGRPSATMGFELFKKIVNDLKEFPNKLKLASIYKDGEPLMNPHFPEMVRYLKDAEVAERIWTKTNGSTLCPELNQKLIDAGLDMICISVEAVSAEGYLKVAKARIDYERFRENVADLYARRRHCEIYVKIADSGLSREEIEKFYTDFQPMSTKIAVEKLMGWSFSDIKDFTLGTNPDTYDGLPLIQKKVCAYPFYVMAANADGSVSLCGNDWAHGTVVGNVNEQSLQDIWRGEALYQFRKTMLEDRRKEIPACANCYYLQIVPDNIDPFRSELLERLSKRISAGE
ncbi:MAG: Radical domain protein [Proteobacteria bacterium]|nr:Radical domain protein [Pseudomonadota bacterium]